MPQRITAEESQASAGLRSKRTEVEGYKVAMHANSAKNSVLKGLMDEKVRA